MPQFKETVVCVQTSRYWDQQAQDFLDKHWIKRKWSSPEAKAEFEKMGSQPPYHYLGSGKIFALVGYGMGQAMTPLLK